MTAAAATATAAAASDSAWHTTHSTAATTKLRRRIGLASKGCKEGLDGPFLLVVRRSDYRRDSTRRWPQARRSRRFGGVMTTLSSSPCTCTPCFNFVPATAATATVGTASALIDLPIDPKPVERRDHVLDCISATTITHTVTTATIITGSTTAINSAATTTTTNTGSGKVSGGQAGIVQKAPEEIDDVALVLVGDRLLLLRKHPLNAPNGALEEDRQHGVRSIAGTGTAATAG
mmetsp:Transcript_29119/g.64159  ORF Transcript_29119/g.64159 Transcript_29119/m.64159 type:complete len:233 (+) Transcript_29119:2855-3553(+)